MADTMTHLEAMRRDLALATSEKEAAVNAQEFPRAARARDSERELQRIVTKLEAADTAAALATLQEAVRDYLRAKDGYFGHVGNTGPATIAEMNAAESRLRSLAIPPTPKGETK